MERREFVPLCQPSLALWPEAQMVVVGLQSLCWVAQPVEKTGEETGAGPWGSPGLVFVSPGSRRPPSSTTKPSGPRVGSSRSSICRSRRVCGDEQRGRRWERNVSARSPDSAETQGGLGGSRTGSAPSLRLSQGNFTAWTIPGELRPQLDAEQQFVCFAFYLYL